MQVSKCNIFLSADFVELLSFIGIRRAPYEAMFGFTPMVDLASTSLPREVFDSMKDKTDLENTLKELDISNNVSDRNLIKST